MKPILYTSKNCVFCGPVKKKLKKKGIDFKEVSIDTREGKKMASKKRYKGSSNARGRRRNPRRKRDR